ncbi:hypothetical protein L1O03_02290 [Corynebacterium uropygiale]|uniref:Uncharacterized protein n=1 Tax=Corynebacterium uropygiale TaxID=1775911 RepID=A0A9X1U6S7_9CORY|nr:hypothetical protein [Corynebacterium uropygiale]MCF4006007.1 hypothetical protein [Corynebacterium uropygiale]
MTDIPTIGTNPRFKHPDEGVIAALPKVVVGLPHSDSLVATLRRIGVVYAELSLSAGATELPEYEDIDVRYVLRGHTLDDARQALSLHGPRLLGFALDDAPDDGVLDLCAEHWLPVSGRLDDLPHGAVQRVECGVEICDDFGVDEDGITLGGRSAWVRDRRVPVLLAATEEDLADHPLPLLRDVGMASVPLSPGNRLLRELKDLVDSYGYGPEELLEITSDALDASFLSLPERSTLFNQVILPAYAELADPEEQEAEDEETHEHEEAAGSAAGTPKPPSGGSPSGANGGGLSLTLDI